MLFARVHGFEREPRWLLHGIAVAIVMFLAWALVKWTKDPEPQDPGPEYLDWRSRENGFETAGVIGHNALAWLGHHWPRWKKRFLE